MANDKYSRTSHKGGTDTYKRTDVMTANRETILLMMYAGAIRFLKRAIEADKNKDLAGKLASIQRCQDIVNELKATLNFEVGGEIATSLSALYDFITERLLLAVKDKNIEFVQEALSILQTLNSAWEEAVANVRKERSEKP